MVETNTIITETKAPYYLVSYTINKSEKFPKEEVTITVLGDFDQKLLEQQVKKIKEAAVNGGGFAMIDSRVGTVEVEKPNASAMFSSKKQ